MKIKLNTIDITALALIIVGGLNWGLVGLFNFNLVGFIFGESLDLIARVVYTLVGVSAIYAISWFMKHDNGNNK